MMHRPLPCLLAKDTAEASTRSIAIDIEASMNIGKDQNGSSGQMCLNAWKLLSQASDHTNCVSVFNNAVIGFAILEKFSIKRR